MAPPATSTMPPPSRRMKRRREAGGGWVGEFMFCSFLDGGHTHAQSCDGADPGPPGHGRHAAMHGPRRRAVRFDERADSTRAHRTRSRPARATGKSSGDGRAVPRKSKERVLTGRTCAAAADDGQCPRGGRQGGLSDAVAGVRERCQRPWAGLRSPGSGLQPSRTCLTAGGGIRAPIARPRRPEVQAVADPDGTSDCCEPRQAVWPAETRTPHEVSSSIGRTMAGLRHGAMQQIRHAGDPVGRAAA
jgi:hypothetical protein